MCPRLNAYYNYWLYRQMAYRHQRNTSDLEQRGYDNTFRDQLERESHNLQNLQPSKRNPSKKKVEFAGRIAEIADLCKEENQTTNQEYKGIISAEKEIFSLLLQTDPECFTANPQRMNHGQSALKPNSPGRYRNGESLREQSKRGFVKPAQSQVQQIHSPAQFDGFNRNTTEEPHQPYSYEPQDNYKYRSRYRENGQRSRENEYRYRENEQRYREDEHNLKDQSNRMKSQVNMITIDSRQVEALRERIAELERELDRERQRSATYRAQLESRKSPDLEALYHQGEIIRQQTLKLLKLKQQKVRNPHGNDIALSERIQELEAENNRLKGRTYEAHSSPKKNGKRSYKDYEEIAAEMQAQ